MNAFKSLFGSKRSRILHEPKRKKHLLSFERKQKVKFRSRYAGSLAKRAGIWVGNAAALTAIVGGCAWLAASGQKYWKKNDFLRIKSVVYSGEVPDALKSGLTIRAGDNILLIHPFQLEKEALARFSELKEISVRRNLNKIVTIDGKFRKPIALTHVHGKEFGVDAEGIVFPLPKSFAPADAALPSIEAVNLADRKARLQDLSTWKKSFPNFYSLVKKIETDRMRSVTVELSDGVSIRFGNYEDVALELTTKHLLKLRDLYKPAKTPALLTVISPERIVMDANWKKTESSK